MAVTQQQIDALNQAIADGVRSVTIDGQTTIYNTSESLRKARDDLQTQYNAEQARTAPRRVPKQTHLYYAGRGYD